MGEIIFIVVITVLATYMIYRSFKAVQRGGCSCSGGSCCCKGNGHKCDCEENNEECKFNRK